MEVLHICAENDNHQPCEILAFDPDPESKPQDFLPRGYHITEQNTIDLKMVQWPLFPSGSTFVNEPYI